MLKLFLLKSCRAAETSELNAGNELLFAEMLKASNQSAGRDKRVVFLSLPACRPWGRRSSCGWRWCVSCLRRQFLNLMRIQGSEPDQTLIQSWSPVHGGISRSVRKRRDRCCSLKSLSDYWSALWFTDWRPSADGGGASVSGERADLMEKRRKTLPEIFWVWFYSGPTRSRRSHDNK